MRHPLILVADDHRIFRKSLIRLVSTFQKNSIFMEASNGEEALNILMSCPVNLLILDIQMPDINGIEVMKRMRDAHLHTPVIVLTQFDEKVLIAYMMQLGARAFLNKNCESEELEGAIRTVLVEGFYQSDTSVKGMRLALNRMHTRLDVSPRERQMILLLKDGKSNKEIANAQGLALRTVESYRKSLLKKTQCKNVTELVSLAYRTGLL